MSRVARLLGLLQLLRQHRRPVAGEVLAAELGISLRTLYRDIDSLRAQGADIAGEAGLGFILRPGFLLPPLMLTAAEIQALFLGAQWVAQTADEALAEAAEDAIAKIANVLPEDIEAIVAEANLLVGPDEGPEVYIDPEEIRRAIARERRAEIDYEDGGGNESRRVIWPFAMGYFSKAQVVVAWCELRSAFRHFRIDRLMSWRTLDTRYPRRRHALLAEWREKEGIRE